MFLRRRLFFLIFLGSGAANGNPSEAYFKLLSTP
jgi:hypothetical protein